MDEAARPGSSQVGEQDQRSPEEIRRDIEETREDLGDTAEALAQKADVKGQAKAKVEGVKQSAQEKAQENPVPLAVGGAFLAGVVVGWLLTR